MARAKADLLISAGQMVTMAAETGVVENGALAAYQGRILQVGPEKQVKESVVLTRDALEISMPDCVATPGLVDCHCHLVFQGWRAEEFERRLQGADYMEILEAGGGILSTVKATREATEAELLHLARQRLDMMLSMGATTVESKSGYGLETEAEMKCLRVMRELDRSHPVDVVPTFLGAHAVPPEFQGDTDGYVDLVCEEMIPRVAREGLARFVDVFCEEGAFDAGQSRRVLECGLKHGLLPRLHADEFLPSGGAELAASIGALSADHLMAASDEGLRAMAREGVSAVLLPGTSFFCRHEPVKAERFRGFGLDMALGTDFNPGSCTIMSIPVTMSLACLISGMSAWEALKGFTLQAARALGLEHEIGSLEPGKAADIVVFGAPNYIHIPYRFGHDLVKLVIKGGKVAIG